jgi:hypothetical protein
MVKRVIVPALVFAVLVLTGCNPHVTLVSPFGKRRPNLHEVFYTEVASDFHDAAMCKKIYAGAINEQGPDFGGYKYWRVDYERSACYFYLALATRMPHYCQMIQTIKTLPSNHSMITPTACLANLRSGNRANLSPTMVYYGLGSLMKEMGYRAEDRYAAEYERNNFINPVYRFYKSVRKTQDFKARVEALPSYAEPASAAKLRPANLDEMLMQAAAVDERIPALCGKISPNAYYVFKGRAAAGRVLLRNHCYFAIAADTDTMALCDKIPSRGASLLPHLGMDRKACIGEIKVQLSPNFHGRPTYGPFPFASMNQFVAALQKIGYQRPLLTGGDTFGWSEFYSYLEFEAPFTEKQKFAHRAEALPTYTR